MAQDICRCVKQRGTRHSRGVLPCSDAATADPCDAFNCQASMVFAVGDPPDSPDGHVLPSIILNASLFAAQLPQRSSRVIARETISFIIAVATKVNIISSATKWVPEDMPSTFHLSAFLPYRLSVLSDRVSRRLSVEYERTHGLSVAEWRVLVHLARCGSVSVRDIHNCVNLEKPRVSRAVSRLEQNGLVRKAPGKGDGRLVAISLTPAGQAVLADIIPAAEAVESSICDAVDPADLRTFFRVMEQMHAALDADAAARPRSRMDVEGLEN